MLIKPPPVNIYLLVIHEKSKCGIANEMGGKVELLTHASLNPGAGALLTTAGGTYG